MPSSDKHNYLPFEEFLATLRNNGFPVGIDAYLKMQQLLNHLEPNTPKTTLRGLLSPLFAKNEKDQERFYRIFDNYFLMAEQQMGHPDSSFQPSEINTPQTNLFQRKGANSIRVSRWIFLLLTLLVSSFFIYIPIQSYRALKGTSERPSAKDYLAKYELNNEDKYVFNLLKYVANDLLLRDQPCDELAQIGFNYTIADPVNDTYSVSFFDQTGDTLSQRIWDMGNGITLSDSMVPSNLLRPVQVYSDTGKYAVGLTVINRYGCTARESKTINIYSPKTCEASFDFAITPGDHLKVSFSDSSMVAPDDPIVKWEWKFGDDNNTTAEESSPIMTFPSYRSYRVCLNITTEKGCKDQICETLELINPTAIRNLLPIKHKPFVNIDLSPLKSSPFRAYYPLFLAIFLAVGWFFYEIYKRYRKRVFLNKERSTHGPYTWPLRLSYDLPVFGRDTLHRVATHLRQRQKSDTLILDMSETIKSTLESGGYPTFKYEPGTRPSEYLVLIEKHSAKDHQAYLFEDLAAELAELDIFIDIYFYPPDFSCFRKSDTAKPIFIEDLSLKYPDHRLIILGDGEGITDIVDGEANPRYYDFETWEDRAILTPVPPANWGLQEVELAGYFLILPAATSSLSVLLDYFDSEQPQQLSEWRKTPHAPIPDFTNEITLDQLRSYLGAEVFIWFASCAVYPECHWDLTLYLGFVLEEQLQNDQLLKEANLLKLARMPYFRNGSIPDDMRVRLVDTLDEKMLKRVREAILEMLEKNPPPEGTLAAERHQMNMVIQKWELVQDKWVKPQDLKDQMEELVEREEVEDAVVLKSMEQGKSSKANLLMPKSWNNVFFRNGFSILGTRIWVRFALIIPILFLLLFPVYQEKITFSEITHLRKWLKRSNTYVEIDGDYYKLKNAQDSARFSSYEGGVFYKQKDFGSAYNKFTEAIDLDRFNSLYYYQRGLSEYQLTRSSKSDSSLLDAYNDFVRSLALNPIYTSTTKFSSASPQPHKSIKKAILSTSGKFKAIATGNQVQLTPIDADSSWYIYQHPGPVLALDISPDGLLTLTSSGSQAYLWDNQTGKQLGTMVKHTRDIRAVKFSPNNNYLLTGAEDNLAIIWNRKTLQSIHELEFIHEAPILSVDFSPDNRLVVTASEDKTAVIWDRSTGQFVSELADNEAAVLSAEFSPDSKLVLTYNETNSLSIWNIEGDRILNRDYTNEELVWEGFSPDGSTLFGLLFLPNTKTWEVQLQNFQQPGSFLTIPIGLLNSAASNNQNLSTRNNEYLSESTEGSISFSADSRNMLVSLEGSGTQMITFDAASFQKTNLQSISGFNKSVIAYEREQFEKAILGFTGIIREDSTDLDAHYGRAMSILYTLENQSIELRDSVRIKQCFWDLETILKNQPNYFDSLQAITSLMVKVYNNQSRGTKYWDRICSVVDKITSGSCDLFKFDEVRPSSDGLSAVRSELLWGYLDSNQTLVIELTLRDAEDFHNGLALVRPKSSSRYVLMNKEGEIEYDVAQSPSDGLRAVRKASTQEWGYMDKDSNLIVIQPQFQAAENFHRGYAKVQRNGYWGIIDKKGNADMYGGFEYTQIVGDFNEKNEITGYSGGSKKLMNRLNYEVPQSQQTSTSRPPPNPPKPTMNSEASPSNKNEIRIIGDLSEGLMRAQKNGKYGYISPQASYNQQQSSDKNTIETSIEFQYEDALDFSFGMAGVKRAGGKWGFVDVNGKAVINFEYDHVQSFIQVEKQVLAKVIRQGETFYINRNGECVSYLKYSCPSKEVKITRELAFYIDKVTGLTVYNENGKWGLRNGDKIVLLPSYSSPIEFANNRLARVEQNGKWGYINDEGKIVIPPQYEDALNFSEDKLAAVKLKGLWGYINEKGKIQIAFKYDLAQPFKNGRAIVRQGKNSYKIDVQGRLPGIRKK